MAHIQLADAIARYTETDGIQDTHIPRLTLVKWSRTGEPIHMLQRPAVCIIAQGRKQVMSGDQVLTYGPDAYLVAALDVPITGMVTQAETNAPYLCFCLYLDPAILSEVVLTLPNRAEAISGSGSALSLHDITPELADCATRMVTLLGDEHAAPMLWPLAERELLYRLLTGPQGQQMLAIASPDSPMGQIGRVVGWLKQHFNEPFSAGHLASKAGMSLSSFHQHFKAITAMSPLQYQKQLRLQEARRLMLSSHIDSADAGFRVGYDSPSQFSREYSRLFGAPPVRDMGRLRARPDMPMMI